MGLFNRIRPDPGFVSPVRSDPIQVLSVRSDPIRSDPIRSDPGFVNGRRGISVLIGGAFERLFCPKGKEFACTTEPVFSLVFSITGKSVF